MILLPKNVVWYGPFVSCRVPLSVIKYPIFLEICVQWLGKPFYYNLWLVEQAKYIWFTMRNMIQRLSLTLPSVKYKHMSHLVAIITKYDVISLLEPVFAISRCFCCFESKITKYLPFANLSKKTLIKVQS